MVVVFPTLAFPVSAAEPSGSLNLGAKREEALKAFQATTNPNFARIEKLAGSLFSKPLTQQSEKDLQLLASQANKAANLISVIQDEYDSSYRSNYRYDFIQEKVAGPRDSYVHLGNKFKSFRNRDYFNLGKK